jgi:hypothetical protein|tara:strand:- start:18573 stop:19154 length:582 start_codon:yes stop_codon:yes gene_type:complete
MGDAVNANGKRPIEDWEVMLGLARESENIANRAEATAKRNQDLAESIVKAAKDTNSLAREARFNAVQSMAKAKKAMPEGATIEEEEVLDPSEEEAILKAESGANYPLTGFPRDGNAANQELEEYFENGTFAFSRGVYEPTGQTEQVIEPGANGRRNDVFEQKELFKRCSPRFFFNGDHKNWRRVAPEGWAPTA